MSAGRAAPSRPMTRTGCVLGCAAWLAVMLVPALAFGLATQNELGWTRGPDGLDQDKIFLVNEPGAGGLGYLAARTLPAGADAGQVCVRTQVVYLLWRTVETGDQNATYCQCYTRAADGTLTLAATVCPGE